MFEDIFGTSPAMRLSTSTDAYLDRLAKILTVRKLALELKDNAIIKAYDDAFAAALNQITIELNKAIKESQEAITTKEKSKGNV